MMQVARENLYFLRYIIFFFLSHMHTVISRHVVLHLQFCSVANMYLIYRHEVGLFSYECGVGL